MFRALASCAPNLPTPKEKEKAKLTQKQNKSLAKQQSKVNQNPKA
jgi:hypothetical protein